MTKGTRQVTKKQHYLPFVYLKYFRCVKSKSNRNNATIIWDDGAQVLEVKVANHCYKTWAYSRKNPNEAEKIFHAMEQDWDETVSRARNGLDGLLLLMQISIYHFRNISIRNLSEIERYEFVNHSLSSFFTQQLMGLPSDANIFDHEKELLDLNWETKIITFDNPNLITSDNPSVFTCKTFEKREYGPLFLPISPTELAVAIDTERYKFKTLRGVDRDSFISNAYVAAQSMRHLYMHTRMADQLRNNLWEFVKRQRATEEQRGVFDGSQFKPGLAIYGEKPNMLFSFLEDV